LILAQARRHFADAIFLSGPAQHKRYAETMRRFVLVLLLIVMLAGPGVESASPQQTLRVLFIGSGYTYVNNLPQMISHLAGAAGSPISVRAIVAGGATLKKHWQDGVATQTIREGTWSHVVLQEQSTLGPIVRASREQVQAPAMFHEYARLFDREIKKAGAKTVLFLVWAHQDAPESQAALTDAHMGIARELDAVVVPVGPAWQHALGKNPALALHQPDHSHPTPAGSYLAACVFYAVLLGKNPQGLPRLGNLNPSDAAFLQRVAWDAAGGR